MELKCQHSWGKTNFVEFVHSDASPLKKMGCCGSVVGSVPCVRLVTGPNPTVIAMWEPWASPSLVANVANYPSKLCAHINVCSKNVFAHISYTLIRCRMSPGKLLHKRNFYVHTDINKLEGTLAVALRRVNFDTVSML